MAAAQLKVTSSSLKGLITERTNFEFIHTSYYDNDHYFLDKGVLCGREILFSGITS